MARPRIEISWVDVEKLCGLQCTEEEIAQYLGVSVDTLARACKREYQMSFAEYFEQKRGRGKVSLRRAQWQAAHGDERKKIAPNPTLLIWLGKQYLNQKDKNAHEHSGPDGKPIETHDKSTDLSDDELNAKIKGLLAKEKRK